MKLVNRGYLHSYTCQHQTPLGHNTCGLVPAEIALVTDVCEDNHGMWVKRLQIVEDDDAGPVLTDELIEGTAARRFHARDSIPYSLISFPFPYKPGTKVIDELRISIEQACKVGREGSPRDRLIPDHQESVETSSCAQSHWPPQPDWPPQSDKVATAIDQISTIRKPVVACFSEVFSFG